MQFPHSFPNGQIYYRRISDEEFLAAALPLSASLLLLFVISATSARCRASPYILPQQTPYRQLPRVSRTVLGVC